MIVFISSCAEVKEVAPLALHNLSADGVLWFVYQKSNGLPKVDEIDRNHGWEPLESKGFRRVSQVTFDDSWTALRFRNNAFVKSSKKPE
jgi:hypothetical protein